MTLKFKIDENLPVEVAAILRGAGYDAVTVFDQQLSGMNDGPIAAIIQGEGRAIVTLDLDFADIRNYPPQDYHGIIVFRLAFQDKHHIAATLQQLLPRLKTEPLAGRLWIVDEVRLRIRS